MFNRNAAINTFLLLAVCCLVVYKMEDALLNKVTTREDHRPKPVYLPTSTRGDDEVKRKLDSPKEDSNKIGDIWITMAVCWSANTHYWGKDKFPYKESAPLSSRLWLRLGVKVMLQVVFSEKEPSDELIEYKKDLEGYGAVVKLVPKSPDMKCVLEAQLIRIFAYLHPEIKDNDVMVTADVDAFPMTQQILAPIVLLSNRSIWLYRYGFTLGTGSTFMMPFIGAKVPIWRSMLNYTSYDPARHSNIGQGLRSWVDQYGKMMNFSKDYTWEVDQHITSRAILSSGLCTLPKDNKLWKDLRLSPPSREFNDTNTCWHGGGTYEDCNNELWARNAMIRHLAGKCMWWHFYPKERYNNLISKFNEIMDGKQESGILNSIIGAARQFEMEQFGQVINPNFG